MTSMTVAEAKAHFSDLLDRVGAGEHVTVTRRGRPAAVVVPVDEAPEQKPVSTGLASLLGLLGELGIEDEEWTREVDAIVASRPQTESRTAAEFD